MITTSQPYFVMASGTTPSWTGRDPRAQLTNVASMTWQQTHPSLAGPETEGLLGRIRTWLRGER
jgi:hypothetical protein